MLIALVLQAADPAAMMAVERLRTTVDTRCVYEGDTADITVCGRRRADRFRVPFANTAVARHDDVPADRAELLHRNTPLQDLSPFLIGGGMVGVHAGVAFGPGGGSGKVDAGRLRPLAP